MAAPQIHSYHIVESQLPYTYNPWMSLTCVTNLSLSSHYIGTWLPINTLYKRQVASMDLHLYQSPKPALLVTLYQLTTIELPFHL